MIDSSAELQERERTKLALAIRDGLTRRGVPPDRAGLVAQIAMVAFQSAFGRWIDVRGQRDFPSCPRTAAAALREAMATDTEPRH